MSVVSGDAAALEEWVDLHLHRPLAAQVAQWLAPTRVTPNHVTIAGGLLGIAAGAVLTIGASRPALRPLAAVLLFASVVFDCADGQLARRRNQSSRAGVMLDGIADYCVSFTMFVGATTVVQATHPGRYVWLLGAAAMISTLVQCLLFDAAKEQYVILRNVAYSPSKLQMLGQWPDVTSRGPAREHAGLVAMFYRYTDLIRRIAPVASPGRRVQPPSPAQLRAWTFLGIGTHLALLYVAAAISYVWPGALRLCLLTFATVMNVALIGLAVEWM